MEDTQKKYKVKKTKHGKYVVMELMTYYDIAITELYWAEVFTGSLCDCEAYIRLHDAGYM